MLDDLFDDLEAVREGPVWQPMPDALRAAWPTTGVSWRRMVLATGTLDFSGGCMAAAR